MECRHTEVLEADKSPDLCWLPLWLWGGAFQNQEMDRGAEGLELFKTGLHPAEGESS